MFTEKLKIFTDFLLKGQKNKDTESHSAKNVLIDCEWENSDRYITALVIADTHSSLRYEEVTNALNFGMPDYVFYLGDIPEHDIEIIKNVLKEKNINAPQYGVDGNHDQRGTVKDHDIIDLHGQTATLKSDITIGGLAGSIRYKDDNRYVLLTNEESEEIMAKMPYCDILLTHDKPCFEEPEYLHAHAGLTGIGNYIQNKHPQVLLHGHLHDPYIKKHISSGTLIRCCYRVETIKIPLKGV